MTLHRAGKQKACFAWGYHMAATPAKRPGGFSFACRGCFATCCPFCSVLLSLPSLKLWQALAESNGMSGLERKKKTGRKQLHALHTYTRASEKKKRDIEVGREQERGRLRCGLPAIWCWVCMQGSLSEISGMTWGDEQSSLRTGRPCLTLKFLQIIDA